MHFNPLNLFLKEIMGKLIIASKNVQIIVSVYTGMWYFLLKRNSITCLQIVCEVCSLYFPFINKSPWWWGRKSTTTGIKSSAVTLCISPLSQHTLNCLKTENNVDLKSQNMRKKHSLFIPCLCQCIWKSSMTYHGVHQCSHFSFIIVKGNKQLFSDNS